MAGLPQQGLPQWRCRSCGLVPASALPNPRPAHMGSWPGQGPAACGGRSRSPGLLFGTGDGAATAGAAERPIKIVALGDSLTAGYQLPAERGVPGAARTGAQGQGARGRDRQCRRLRRYQLRRAGAARLVGAGRHRRGDPRARRQRHAARHRSQGHARGAGRDRPPPEGAPHRGAAVRHAGGAESWRRTMGARSTRSIRSLPPRTVWFSTRSSSTASFGDPKLKSGDGLHPTAPGVATIVARHSAQGGGLAGAGAGQAGVLTHHCHRRHAGA